LDFIYFGKRYVNALPLTEKLMEIHKCAQCGNPNVADDAFICLQCGTKKHDPVPKGWQLFLGGLLGLAVGVNVGGFFGVLISCWSLFLIFCAFSRSTARKISKWDFFDS
jgi:hypothetical protein